MLAASPRKRATAPRLIEYELDTQSPVLRAPNVFLFIFLGLAPQALCLRLLRRLYPRKHAHAPTIILTTFNSLIARPLITTPNNTALNRSAQHNETCLVHWCHPAFFST